MFFFELLSCIGSFASLLSIILTKFDTLSDRQMIGVYASAMFTVVALVFIFARYFRNRPKQLKTDKQIADYMYSWISSSGRVAMFTRDMSWADERIKELLRKKARNGELCISLPQSIPLAKELKGLGAEINVYPKLRFTPKSRFTIIRRGRGDSRVAVGYKHKDIHRIEEFSVGEHPFLQLADDMVELVAKMQSLN